VNPHVRQTCRWVGTFGGFGGFFAMSKTFLALVLGSVPDGTYIILQYIISYVKGIDRKAPS
jgi:hypothetical protein